MFCPATSYSPYNGMTMPRPPAVSPDPLLAQSNEGPADSFPPLGPNLKALMVWPRFPPSFWGFEGMLEVLPERSVMPPLGLITLAALCPANWQIRLIDRAFEELLDTDLLWADLVMVSAMHAQRADARVVLSRARSLGRRTFIGGPWASSEPEAVVSEADHLLVGEAEDVFADIATALEQGTARRLYRKSEKPDMTRSPAPRIRTSESPSEGRGRGGPSPHSLCPAGCGPISVSQPSPLAKHEYLPAFGI